MEHDSAESFFGIFLVILAMVTFVLFTVANAYTRSKESREMCEEAYSKGFDEGYDLGTREEREIDVRIYSFYIGMSAGANKDSYSSLLQSDKKPYDIGYAYMQSTHDPINYEIVSLQSSDYYDGFEHGYKIVTGSDSMPMDVIEFMEGTFFGFQERYELPFNE